MLKIWSSGDIIQTKVVCTGNFCSFRSFRGQWFSPKESSCDVDSLSAQRSQLRPSSPVKPKRPSGVCGAKDCVRWCCILMSLFSRPILFAIWHFDSPMKSEPARKLFDQDMLTCLNVPRSLDVPAPTAQNLDLQAKRFNVCSYEITLFWRHKTKAPTTPAAPAPKKRRMLDVQSSFMCVLPRMALERRNG